MEMQVRTTMDGRRVTVTRDHPTANWTGVVEGGSVRREWFLDGVLLGGTYDMCQALNLRPLSRVVSGVTWYADSVVPEKGRHVWVAMRPRDGGKPFLRLADAIPALPSGPGGEPCVVYAWSYVNCPEIPSE